MEYNEMNQNEKTLISVHQDGRQLLSIHARLLEAISNLCPRRVRITCPFAGLLFQQMCLCNMNWVSSVSKLTHRPGGRGLIPVIVWSFSLNFHAGFGVHSASCSVGTTSSFCVPNVDANAKLNFFPPSSEVPQ